jgi:flavin reductase (DIM6/NTAB) family NADH-FMN oxidoreductase RutF
MYSCAFRRRDVSLKALAKALLRPLPQWAPVAISPPQQAISVSLISNGNAVDVTRCHAIASLQPLSVAIRLDAATRGLASGTLAFTDLVSRKTIGSLQIGRITSKDTDGANIGVFRIIQSDQRCLPWPRRPWNEMFQARAIRRFRKPHNFYMPPADVQKLMVFYICPRPVVLVTVSEDAHSNIFPMDLIGTLGNQLFTLALRNTSVSVPTMVSARRLAISGIRSENKDIAYKLGEHHKREFVDWGSLPLPIFRTEHLKLPAIASALWVKELTVDSSEVIGSHTFFACRIVSDYQLSSGLQLHHTSGFHQEYRRRRGVPFDSA